MRDKTTRDFVVSTLSYETLQVSRTQPIPPLYFEIAKEVNISVVGSCNGLVCLHDYRELHDVIWNPATKETKVVPKSNLPRFAPAGYHTFNEGIGFGFDAKTNDYKIINILCICDSYSYLDIYKEGVMHQKEVYSLSADSWRKVDGPSCFLYNGFEGPGTYINGMASWLAYVGHWESYVLTFDMSDEVFQKTPLPDNVTGNMLFTLNESIAMSVESVVDEECFALCFDIWLLLKVGSKDSWTRLFTIGPFTEPGQSGYPYPLGFWTNDAMFVENSNGQLVLYDPSTKQMTNLQIWHGDRNSLQLVSYMETLVSVKGGNEFEEQEA